MLDPGEHGFISEFYVVAKSIEVQVRMGGEATRIRVDALEQLGTGNFTARAYREEVVLLKPRTTNAPRTDVETRVWADFDLPWTDRKSADEVLNQALGFLYAACDK